MKTKNLFFSVLAMTGMLFASCSQEELINEPSVSTGDYVDATFTIGTTGALATRAIGEGLIVDEVVCAVFDENGDEMEELRKYEAITGKTAKYEIRLAKGQNYRVAFFAYNKASKAYDVADLKNIKIMGEQKSNLESRDAFTAYVDIVTGETMNAVEKTVTLTRPFAQLNLGIDAEELADARKAGVVIEKTEITVSDVYNAFSAYDNAISSTATASDVTFSLNEIPEEVLYADVNGDGVKEEYTYLALNYLLVGDTEDGEKSLTDVEFVWTTEDGKTNDPTTHFPNIPVERNYRTNLLGRLITNPATFNIVIDEQFAEEGDMTKDKNKIYTDDNGVMTAIVADVEELEDAIEYVSEEAPAGDYYISLEELAGAQFAAATRAANTPKITLAIAQRDGVNLVIDGCKKNFDARIVVDGKNRYQGEETLRIKGINFVTEESDFTFITGSSVKNNYPHNITIEDCTFEGNQTVGSINFKQMFGLVVKNCTATNMHSILQAQSCDNTVWVENVKTVDCKNGVSFGNTANATLKNSNIKVVGYGVRADGDASRGNLVIENTTVNAVQPVIVRKMTTSYNAKLANVDLNTADELYHVVFTNGDDAEAYVAPTGKFSIEGAEDYRVYPSDVLVGTEAELVAALKNLSNINAVVKLTSDITVTTNWDNRYTGAKITVPVVINGEGHTLKFTNTIDDKNYFAVFRFENDAVVKNLKFDLSEALGTSNRFRAISAKANLEVNNCEFVGNSAVSNTRGISFGEGQSAAQFDAEISITDSKFVNWKRGVTDNENAKDAKKVVVENNTFENAPVYVSAYEYITVSDNEMSGNSNINITSYSSAADAKVKATGNTLVTEYNQIGSSSKRFGYFNVEAQEGFNVYYAE